MMVVVRVIRCLVTLVHNPSPRTPPRPPFPTFSYLAHGTATDYMHEVLHVPLAFTWEIFGDFDAPFEDCFRMFNPLDEAGYKVGGG